MRALVGRIGSGRIVLEAATGTMLEVGDRIWGRGELTSGGIISYKENYPVYITKPPFPAVGSKKGKPFDLWAKPPNNLKGTARNVQGGWYPTYLAAKTAVNRGDLPFELTGDLRKDWFGGVTPSPTEVDEFTVVIDVGEKSRKIIDGLTATKGEFVVLNDREVEAHHKRIADLWGGILSA